MINNASCTGAQTSTPSLTAKQHAKRSISAPLPCIGKFKSERDLVLFVDMHMPVEAGMQRSLEARVVENPIGPIPKDREGVAMRLEKLAGDDWELPDAKRKTLVAHAILHRENARLELLAYGLMRFFGCIRRDGAGLLCKLKVGIAALIGGKHRRIAAEGRRNSEFLLLPIEIGDPKPRLRLDQPAHPFGRAEDELRVARLIAAGLGLERAEKRSVSVRPCRPSGLKAAIAPWRDEHHRSGG